MSRGILMYAHNNTEIDYFKIACANALMVQKNLQVPVTLVTDEGTYSWSEAALGKEFIDACFEKIIIVKRNYDFNNPRNFSDTSYNNKSLQFYNCNHWEAYELSPYDETLFIDADYLIMSSALSNCWGSDNEVMINHRIMSPIGEIESRSIDNFGIRLYWATVIYFKKSDFAKFLFDIVQDIQEKYAYYKDLYCFSSGMYRNDNAFSIAIHMLNGFSGKSSVVGQLPIPALLMAWDTTDILQINQINDISVYAEKEDVRGEYVLVRFKDTDIHLMNKWSINRHSQTLIDMYRKI